MKKNRENIPEREQIVQGLEPRGSTVDLRSYSEFSVAGVCNECARSQERALHFCRSSR